MYLMGMNRDSMKNPGNSTVNLVTPEKKREFIEHFRETGNVTKSARALEMTRQTVYSWINEDEQFKEEFENAQEEALDLMEAECKRRAEDGCLKPVFYQGMKCGEILEYSDTLMMFFLKGNRPEKYKDRGEIEHKGNVLFSVVYENRPVEEDNEAK